VNKKFLLLVCLAASLATPLRAAAATSPAEAPEKPASTERIADFGINLDGPSDWGTEFPFVDFMKTSREWISQREGVWDSKEPLDVDENGYIKTLQPGQWAVTLMATETGKIVPPGRYTFFYEGEGEVQWEGLGRFVENIGPGRDIIEVMQGDASYIKMTIKSVNPENPLRNLHFVRPGHEETFKEKPFSPEFLATWSKAGTFRFMDWMHTNVATTNKTWEDRTRPENVRYNQKSGVPIEVMVELCNQTGANGWFCIPHLADDDYIRKIATMIREKLDPSLVATFEFSNEVWNPMFSQTQWAEKQGMAEGLGTKPWEAGWAHYSKDCRRMFDIIDEVYATDPHRRRRVVSSQAANPHIIKQILKQNDLPAHCDAIAIAPYITFNVPLEGKEGRPGVAEVAGWSMEQLFEHLRNVSLPESMERITKHAEVAKNNGLDLVAYEGGQHLSALGEAMDNKELVQLLIDANRDPRMGEIYTDYLNHWTEAGGKLHNFFTSVGRYGRYGAWGHLEAYNQDPSTAPKYQAALKWATARAQSAEAAP
jgi:hypothetical protein